MTASLPVMLLLAVLVPERGWYPADQPVMVRLRSTAPVRLVLADFAGRVIEPQEDKLWQPDSNIDLKALYSTILPGGYVLYEVPADQQFPAFVGNPLVVSVRGDPRPIAPRTPLAWRVDDGKPRTPGQATLELKRGALLRLERTAQDDTVVLSEAQIQLLERHSVDFRCRHVEASRPGELLNQDTFYWGTLKGVGKVYVQVVVDVVCALAFAKVYSSKMPVTACELLSDRGLPVLRGARRAGGSDPHGQRARILRPGRAASVRDRKSVV